MTETLLIFRELARTVALLAQAYEGKESSAFQDLLIEAMSITQKAMDKIDQYEADGEITTAEAEEVRSERHAMMERWHALMAE